LWIADLKSEIANPKSEIVQSSLTYW
jgi:hypothetical protein